MTLAIVGRMLYLRRQVIDVLGKQHGRMYTSIATMFLESGALYSSVAILYMACFAAGEFFANVAVQPLLGQLLVRRGRE